MKVYFSDFFNVEPTQIEKYGAFNLSLINDLPLFIDPFLLFNSDKKIYKKLHDDIIKYVAFLRDRSDSKELDQGLIKAWYLFPEVKQNWFGYSKVGNKGSGLGIKFANSLNDNLHNIFTDFGSEKITKGSHLEKLCLIKDGVGKDNISDFTTNLIKKYLLEYTEQFSKEYIKEKYLKEHVVQKVDFNYATRSWMPKKYLLPTLNNDFVLLTPKDILTKDSNWINRSDMINDFNLIVNTIPNDQLRAQLNNYLERILPEKYNDKEYDKAVVSTINRFPDYIDYFIKFKEDNGTEAIKDSAYKVKETEYIFIEQVKSLVNKLTNDTSFYNEPLDSLDAARQRVKFLKDIIENNDGYRIFYANGKPLKREQDLQLLFKLTWFATAFDVNAEVNNGRGPVDFKISYGNLNKSLVEFKLASNNKLKQNLKNQVQIYETANQTTQSIKVILYFSDQELTKVLKILKELELKENKDLVLIDARDNKISASNVKQLF